MGTCALRVKLNFASVVILDQARVRFVCSSLTLSIAVNDLFEVEGAVERLRECLLQNPKSML